MQMGRLQRFGCGLILAFFMAVAMAAAAKAGVIRTLDANGQLTGARNVDVGGTLYDISFVEGSCFSVFSGCNQNSDFDFFGLEQAGVAAQALVDQVFLDVLEGQFDSDPSLTLGCSSTVACSVAVPSFVNSVNGVVFVEGAIALNEAGIGGSIGFLFLAPGDSIGADSSSVFARFNLAQQPPNPAGQIPEPATLLLFGLGLAGLAGSRFVSSRRRAHPGRRLRLVDGRVSVA